MQNPEKTAVDAGIEHVQGALLIMKAHQGEKFAMFYAAGMLAGIRNYLAVVHSSRTAYEMVQAVADNEIALAKIEGAQDWNPKQGEAA